MVLVRQHTCVARPEQDMLSTGTGIDTDTGTGTGIGIGTDTDTGTDTGIGTGTGTPSTGIGTLFRLIIVECHFRVVIRRAYP